MKNIFLTKWKVIRTVWPYKEGYGTYRKNWLTGEITVLNTGLTKEDAAHECDVLNGKKPSDTIKFYTTIKRIQ